MGPEFDLAPFLKKVNAKYKLEFAVIFGSRARGDSLKSSDYDVLFVSNESPSDIFQRMSDILGLWEGNVGIEPICFSLDEFEARLKTMNPIVWESLKEGKVVWGEEKFRKYRNRFNAAVEAGYIDISKTIRFLRSPEAIFS